MPEDRLNHLKPMLSGALGAVTSLLRSVRRPFQGFPEQVTRLFVVFVLFVGAVLLVRVFLIPPSLKETGFHRESTIERVSAQEIRYAGAQTCAMCHDGESAVLSGSYHRNLSCETCHGPAQVHAEDPEAMVPPAPRGREFCPQCHAYDPSRPTGYPQINATIHNPLQPCVGCHDPHDPAPPEAVNGCSGCHSEISRTKALSPHALLECTTCHTAPEEHASHPRAARPTVPSDRAFCGDCHARGSTVAGAPQVDLAEHQPKYLCWQCHYPHLPEATR